jgi:membrane fusion protein, multidrug efflux system
VAAGQTVITEALAGEVEVPAAVPEHEIAKLKPGMRATVAVWSAPGITSQGSIREIGSAADPASRTYSVRVAIDHPAPEMRIGMTALVAFNLPQEVPAPAVPLAALAQQNGKTIVFVVDKGSLTAAHREVETGVVGEEGVRILSGLKPGEIIVTGGVQFLKDGMKVALGKEILTAAVQTVTAER